MGLDFLLKFYMFCVIGPQISNPRWYPLLLLPQVIFSGGNKTRASSDRASWRIFLDRSYSAFWPDVAAAVDLKHNVIHTVLYFCHYLYAVYSLSGAVTGAQTSSSSCRVLTCTTVSAVNSLWVFFVVFFAGICQVKPRTRKSTKVAKREDRKKKKRTGKRSQDGEKKDSDRADHGWTEQTCECTEDPYHLISSRAEKKGWKKLTNVALPLTFSSSFVNKRYPSQNNKYVTDKSRNCALVLSTHLTKLAAKFQKKLNECLFGCFFLFIFSKRGRACLSCELRLLLRHFKALRYITPSCDPAATERSQDCMVRWDGWEG